MAKTYAQLQKDIQRLQRQADALRNTEIKGVVERIRVAIAHYGITAAQLGLEASRGGRSTGRLASKPAGGPAAKYGDAEGHVWSGRGPRPRWLRAALESGRSLEEFAIGGAEAATPAAAARKPVRRRPSTKLYTDGAGHSWTGRGPKPGWLKAALAEGKSIEDFAKK